MLYLQDLDFFQASYNTKYAYIMFVSYFYNTFDIVFSQYKCPCYLNEIDITNTW